MYTTQSVFVHGMASASACGTGEAAAWLDTIGFCHLVSDASTALHEPSSVNAVEKNTTEKNTQGSKWNKIPAIFKKAWRTIKKPFLCCKKTTSPTPREDPHPKQEADPQPDPHPDPKPEPVAGSSELQDSAVPKPSSVTGISIYEPNSGRFRNCYAIDGILGFGSFGVVFRGNCKSDGKKVAIKRIRGNKADSYIFIPGCHKPLLKEAALLVMLRRPPISPFVIEMYEWFSHSHSVSLILEYPQPCKSLRKFVSSNSGRLVEPIACHFMCQLVLAVHHCIDHGVFHNDIHTENILVNTKTLQLKLIDFGSAHLLDSDGYDSTGAFEYSPPEIYKQPKYYAVPTNVWALGVVLYEIVNGQLPFFWLGEILRARPTTWIPNLSNTCRDLISTCLSFNPARRPTFKQILMHRWFRIRE